MFNNGAEDFYEEDLDGKGEDSILLSLEQERMDVNENLSDSKKSLKIAVRCLARLMAKKDFILDEYTKLKNKQMQVNIFLHVLVFVLPFVVEFFWLDFSLEQLLLG